MSTLSVTEGLACPQHGLRRVYGDLQGQKEAVCQEEETAYREDGTRKKDIE